jgi:Holliday junction resolvase RusA-like endonuclease
MMFRMPTKEASRYGYPHTQTPDSDNLAKLVLDAMQSSGFLPNDSAVSQLEIFKTWAPLERAGVSVIITEDETKPSHAPTPEWLTNKKASEGG